jgi:YbbR domain-containing protein
VLRNRFRQNLGLRIIALLLGVALWVFVNAGQHSSVESYNVPISYRGLPIGFVITNQHPDFVKIQIAGPQTLLSLVDPSRLMLRLDLNGVGVGQASFKIGPDAFNANRGTAVTNIFPAQIVLDIDKIVVRYLPVHLVTAGRPADGYQIGAIEIAPPTVRVKAPSRELTSLEAVDTEAVDVTGLAADTTHVAAVASPGGMMRVEPTQVMVKIAASPLISTKDFHGVPVVVRNNDLQSRVVPGRINLTLRGSILQLRALNLTGSAYIDGDGMEPGTYNVPVQVQLPLGVELLHIWPDKVRIRVRPAARH